MTQQPQPPADFKWIVVASLEGKPASGGKAGKAGSGRKEKTEMAAEHAELVGEMASLEKMQMSERLKQAKKRRAQQLKTYCQYEKQLEKENGKRGRKHLGSSGSSTGSKSGVQTKPSPRLRFEESVLLLDAASRNDLDEGKYKLYII